MMNSVHNCTSYPSEMFSNIMSFDTSQCISVNYKTGIGRKNMGKKNNSSKQLKIVYLHKAISL
jgi:hypothetical protein